MTRRKPPVRGNLRTDDSWYRPVNPDGTANTEASWHFLRTWTRVPGRLITVCGRTFDSAEVSNLALPRGKTCETCLRLDHEGVVTEVQEA